jgi:uncharacterized membrane protein
MLRQVWCEKCGDLGIGNGANAADEMMIDQSACRMIANLNLASFPLCGTVIQNTFLLAQSRFCIMGFSWGEFQKGLVETQKYLLSHHKQSNWDHCYILPIFSWDIRICARCSGIYPGIIVGLATYNFVSVGFSSLILLSVLPLPALLDWSLTSFTKRGGNNIIRTITGALLGYGYAVGLVELVIKYDLRVLLLGVIYAIAAGVLLWYKGDID